MPHIPAPSLMVLAARAYLAALLLFLIYFTFSTPAMAACGNASCSRGVCEDSAGNNCLWRSDGNGMMSCYTSECPPTGMI